MRSGRFIIYILFFLSGVHFLYAHELLISGVYLGKNIYVQNPSCSDQSEFSTRFVYVNGELKVENPTTSTFVVDLSDYPINTQLEIKIVYSENCTPQLINPQVIKPKNSFNFEKVAAMNDSLIWETTGEKGIHKFFIEKRTGSDWLIMQTCDGKELNKNLYRIKLNDAGGNNIYRLKYINETGRIFYSPVINYNPEKESVEFGNERSGKKE